MSAHSRQEELELTGALSTVDPGQPVKMQPSQRKLHTIHLAALTGDVARIVVACCVVVVAIIITVTVCVVAVRIWTNGV